MPAPEDKEVASSHYIGKRRNVKEVGNGIHMLPEVT